LSTQADVEYWRSVSDACVQRVLGPGRDSIIGVSLDGRFATNGDGQQARPLNVGVSDALPRVAIRGDTIRSSSANASMDSPLIALFSGREHPNADAHVAGARKCSLLPTISWEPRAYFAAAVAAAFRRHQGPAAARTDLRSPRRRRRRRPDGQSEEPPRKKVRSRSLPRGVDQAPIAPPHCKAVCGSKPIEARRFRNPDDGPLHRIVGAAPLPVGARPPPRTASPTSVPGR
jgi:hypothetical protein